MIEDWMKREYQILLKYKDGRDIDPEDKEIINELCSIGLMNRGISLKRKQITAKITFLGRKILGEIS